MALFAKMLHKTSYILILLHCSNSLNIVLRVEALWEEAVHAPAPAALIVKWWTVC